MEFLFIVYLIQVERMAVWYVDNDQIKPIFYADDNILLGKEHSGSSFPWFEIVHLYLDNIILHSLFHIDIMSTYCQQHPKHWITYCISLENIYCTKRIFMTEDFATNPLCWWKLSWNDTLLYSSTVCTNMQNLNKSSYQPAKTPQSDNTGEVADSWRRSDST